jgi:DNA replication protein DnaC
MERLGDTLGNYPLRRRQPPNGNGASEQLSLDHLLGEAGLPEPPVREAAAPPQQPKVVRRQEGEQVCPICHGAGYLGQDLPVDDPNFGKIVPCACKEKELKQKRRMELKGLANLDWHSEQTFQTFNQTVPGAQEAYNVALAYARNPDGRWLVLSGPVGCGKTHLAAAIANVCLNRGSLVIFSPVPDLLDYLRRTFAPANEELPYHELFDRIQQAELLVLDDLGVERATPWASEKLFQIIDFRYLARFPTVITTNTDPFKSDIKGLDIRILSRLRDVGLVNSYNMKTQDYRPRNVPAKQVRRP